MQGVLISGRISHVVADMQDQSPVCLFRVGNIRCRALDSLAELIIGHQGYARHTVRIEGVLVGQIVNVCSLTLVD